MVSLDDAVVARFKKDGKTFEVLVDPNLAFDLRNGKQVSIRDLLAYDAIYKDARKGLLASESDLQEVFKTTDPLEIGKTIVLKGDVELTTEQRRRILEETKRKIVAIIAKRAVNPQTKTPHPATRIELAMDQAKVRVDPSKPAEQQITRVVEEIRKVLPISLETIKLMIKVPAKFTGKAYAVLKQYDVVQEDWLTDGTLVCVIRIPAGIQGEVYDALGKVTHGNLITNVIE